MPALIALLVFVVVSLGGFVVFSLLDERKSRARVLRDRLASTNEAGESKPLEDIALLRDEMLSEIPALDTLLRRSDRVSALQKMLSQADIKIRAGNFLLLVPGCRRPGRIYRLRRRQQSPDLRMGRFSAGLFHSLFLRHL